MTPELIELSKQAAEVLGVPAKRFVLDDVINGTDEFSVTYSSLWLAEDSGRCADIANDRRIDIYHDEYSVATNYRGRTLLSDYNGDRKQACRVAILKAVIELGKGE